MGAEAAEKRAEATGELVAPESGASRPSRMPNTFAQIRFGLGLGFGIPFAFGIVYRGFGLFGWPFGTAFGLTWLIAELVTIAALMAVVLSRERLTLGSVGIREVASRDFRIGSALYGGMIALSIVAAAIYLRIRPSRLDESAAAVSLIVPSAFEALRGVSIVLALAVVVASALAEELAARGYAIERLRAVIGSAPAAGIGAVLLDLVAHIPLWGVRYAILMSPAGILLATMYVRGRRLAPSVFARVLFNITVLAAMALWMPAGAGAHRERPGIAGSSSERERAIDNLNRALQAGPPLDAPIQANPKTAAEFGERASAYLRKGQLDKAIADSNTAVKLEPRNREWLKLRGEIHSYVGSHDVAIADYGAMIALDGHDVEAYRLRAAEDYQKNDLKTALADVESAMKIAPKDTHNYKVRGQLYFATGDYDRAIADMDAALQLEPKNLDLLRSRAAMFQQMGQYDRAIADCDRMVAIKPNDSEPYRYRAGEYQFKGDFQNAIADIGEALKRKPNDAGLYLTRAELEILVGRWVDAHSDYEQVARVNPDNADFLDTTAWSLATSTRPGMLDGRTAVALATRACQLTSWRNWKYLDTLAAAYAEVGDFGQAVRWQQEAIRWGGNLEATDVIGIKGRLRLYEQGRVYREEDDGPKSRSKARIVLALIAWIFLAIGVVTTFTKAISYFGQRRHPLGA